MEESLTSRRGCTLAGEAAEPVIDVADLLCGPAGNRSGWRRIGDRWVARCRTTRKRWRR